MASFSVLIIFFRFGGGVVISSKLQPVASRQVSNETSYYESEVPAPISSIEIVSSSSTCKLVTSEAVVEVSSI